MTFSEFINNTANIVITLIGVVGVYTFWKGGLNFLRTYNRASKAACNFIDKILPAILQGLETRQIIPQGTLAKWTEIASVGFGETTSPRRLNKKGIELLEKSGIKKIIDDNLNKFLKMLEDKKLKTAYDVEQVSFYVVKSIEKTDKIIPIKNYLYNNPEQNIFTIFSLGSIYLRDKYLEKHSEIIKN